MRKLLILLLILSSLFLVACGHIEDTNGSDTSLVTISLEKLSGKSTGIQTSGVSTEIVRENITINTFHEDIDYDLIEMEGGISSGVQSIMATELKKGQSLLIEAFVNVTDGNVGLILISPDNEIMHEFKIGEYDSFHFTADKKGEYIIRIGCESFSGNVLLARSFE